MVPRAVVVVQICNAAGALLYMLPMACVHLRPLDYLTTPLAFQTYFVNVWTNDEQQCTASKLHGSS